MSHVIKLNKPIGEDYWGDGSTITGPDFVAEIEAHANEDIELRIDCLGGDVFQARSMHNALLRHTGSVTAYVDSIAASAATFVMTAADRIVVAANAQVMVHRAWGMTIGNSVDHTKQAAVLETMDRNIAEMYERRANDTDVEAWLALMDAETWLTAAEAVELGLADEVSETGGSPTKVARAELKRLGIRHAPAALIAEEDVPEDGGNAPDTVEPEADETVVQEDTAAVEQELEAPEADPYAKELLYV